MLRFVQIYICYYIYCLFKGKIYILKIKINKYMVNHGLITRTEQYILQQMEMGARTPLSVIGKRTRMSQQRISYALDSLMKNKVINGFFTLIDYAKLGILNFRVYFKVSYTNDDEFDKLIERLRTEPSTSWIATCGGRYDLLVTFFASNPSSFNKTIKDIMREFPNQLENCTILTTIVMRNFGRKYLFPNNTSIPKEIILGGDREPEQLDSVDLQLLWLVSDNARISAVEIGSKLNLTAKTVISRLKKLMNRKIIRGYRPILNVAQTGRMTFIVTIKSHNVVPEIEDKLVQYLMMHPNVVSIIKTLGEWDLEIQIEVESWYLYRKIIFQIRQKFKSLIQEIETTPLYDVYHKISYFPQILIS
jgi:Lrp/AsnC family leucine-responsive transcriptional regulator